MQEGAMTRHFVGLLASGFVMALSIGMANAQPVLNLVGTWTGTTQAIVDGVGGHHPADAPSRPAGPYRLRDFPFTYRIDGQDGRRFWGVGTSGNQSERIIGLVSADGQRIYIVDTDGYFDGVVMNTNTLEICYRQAGATSAVVACDVVTRQKK
jgi:hypothetical protein